MATAIVWAVKKLESIDSEMTSYEPTARQATFAAAAITLVAMGLRLFRIDAQSAWFDEAFTIHAPRLARLRLRIAMRTIVVRCVAWTVHGSLSSMRGS